MNIDTMLSQILYCLSGFLFGIFASRYSVISWRTLASRPPLLQCAPYVLFIIAAFTLFPFWLITRTEAGGFIYYATLLFFFTKATALIRRMSPNMSENKTNNTVICDSCGHSARIHPQLADKYVQPMAEIFKVLGDPTRIKILELLSHEDMCVSNIAEMLDMTHSAISHQLRQLRHAQLVKFSKSGKEVIYSLDDEHVLTLFAQALDHVKHKV